jgi:CheY-like chemotaxis protein
MVARILVVAADPATLDLAAAVLDNDGYVVLRADGGTATLRALQTEGYDILVTDDMFPQIDGVLLIRYLRDYPGLALPIILLAPTRPIPIPPNTIHLATPITIDSLSTLVEGLLALAHGDGW